MLTRNVLLGIGAMAFLSLVGCTSTTPQYATPASTISPYEQQILNVQAAEQQIKQTEQAVALEKARAEQQAAKAKAAASQKRAKAQAEINARKQAQQQQLQDYENEMRQLNLESKRLEVEAQRSNVQTQIDLNKVRQDKALDYIEKEINSKGTSRP